MLDRINNAHPFECTTITYHVWWPGAGDPFYLANVAENTARTNYYGVNAVPQVYIDGADAGSAGGQWEGMMLNRYDVESPLLIELTGEMLTETTGEITANIVNTSTGAVSGKLHFVLIENNCTYSSSTYQHVMRDFFPGNTAGETISLNAGNALVRTEPFTIAGTWARENLVCIVFVQNDTTKEIYQAGRIFFELDGPELATNGILLDDSAGGNGNGRLDPGETAEVAVGLANLNAGTATTVVGTLTGTDPLGTIDDGAGAWADIPYGTTGFNTGDPFVVTADESTAWGYSILTTLAVTADNGFSASYIVGIPVGSPGNPIGPDAYGYYAYEDCDSYTQSPVYSWVEIDPNLGGPGTLVFLSDDATLIFDMPFPFMLYGIVFTRVSICSNGWISMGQCGPGNSNNVGIPALAGPPSMIAPFWTNLDPGAVGSGKVYQYFDAANHRYIVEYNGVEHYDDDGLGLPETFEIIMYDPAYYPTPTGDGEIVLQYALVNDAGGCTVGIENQAETIGIQYLYNDQLSAAGSGLAVGRAIKFTTVVPSSAAVDENPNASQATLLRAGPNPARGATQISYDLPAASDVTLRIFSLEGALVRTLLNGHVAAGPGVVEWDGRSDRGRDVPAGVYFYRLSGPDFEVSRKIVKQD